MRTKYAVVERRGSHYTITCDFISNTGDHFNDQVVFEGTRLECESFAAEHGWALKTRECWDNMLLKGSVRLTDMAVLAG